MRLICPNCGAQYEVADDVIPSAGRDVQCSSCAHTWFETPGASEAREAGGEQLAEAPSEPPEDAPAPDEPPRDAKTRIIETAMDSTASDPSDTVEARRNAKTRIIENPDDTPSGAASDTPEVSSRDVKTRIIDPEAAERIVHSTDTDTDTGTVAKEEDSPSGTEDVPHDSDYERPERQPLPSSVSDILREEAAREEAKREADASGGLESQPDLGLDRPLDRDEQLAEEARRRMARLKGEAAPAIGAATATAAGARSDLLPDIDEINSSLRSETDRSQAASGGESEAEAPKSGFRRGFMTIIILALLALLIYVIAPMIGAAVPALEQPLSQYVDIVDRLRLWLDLRLQGLMGGSTASDGS